MQMLKEIWRNILLHEEYFQKGDLHPFQREHNYKTFALGSIPIFFLSLLFVLQNYFLPDLYTKNPFGSVSFLFVFSILVITSTSFLALSLFLHSLQNKEKEIQVLIFFYSLFLLTCGAVLSALSLFDDRDLTGYILLLFSISILYSGPPLLYILFQIWASFNFFGLVYCLGLPQSLDLFLNILSISVIGLFMSAVVQFSRIQNQILTINLKESNRKLNEISVRDPLTQLYNRRFFVEFLENRIHYCRRMREPLLVMLIDVDNFKHVNDRLGHLIGDQVLVDLANIIRSAVRDSDIVARYGGEEFIVVLPNANLESGTNIGARILTLCENHQFENVPWSITVSAGLAELTDGDNSVSLLARSDHFLYKSKEHGRNQINFE